ncbi:MAG: hypothetical protein WBD74_13760 [Candidatus Aquilonibacter sp.]
MDMLSRYLYAIYNDLPKKSAREDIIAEIGDALQSRIDEREAALGRPLTDDEEAAIIKAYGHPRIVAGRYDAVPYLIGPDLLPFYWYTLRLVLTIVLAIILIGGALVAIGETKISIFFAALVAAKSAAIYIFGAVTAAFAVLERVQNKTNALERSGITRWDPRRLPPPPGPSGFQPVSRVSTAIEFIVNVIAILALLDVPGFRYWILYVMVAGPLAAVHIPAEFNYPAWTPAYAGALLGAAVIAIADVIAFYRPTLGALYRWIRVAANTVTLIGVAITLTRTPLVLPADSPFNLIATYTLYGAIAVLGIQIAVLLYKLLRHTAAPEYAPAAWEKPI